MGRESLLLVAVPADEAHQDWGSLVDQQAVHGFLDLLLVQGRRGVHICKVLCSHVRAPPVWTLRLHPTHKLGGQSASVVIHLNHGMIRVHGKSIQHCSVGRRGVCAGGWGKERQEVDAWWCRA